MMVKNNDEVAEKLDLEGIASDCFGETLCFNIGKM